MSPIRIANQLCFPTINKVLTPSWPPGLTVAPVSSPWVSGLVFQADQFQLQLVRPQWSNPFTEQLHWLDEPYQPRHRSNKCAQCAHLPWPWPLLSPPLWICKHPAISWSWNPATDQPSRAYPACPAIKINHNTVIIPFSSPRAFG